MNSERKAIQRKYDIAVKRMNSANTEEEFNSAEAEVTELRTKLIEAEAKYPTQQEIKRQSRNRWLANTGHDIF